MKKEFKKYKKMVGAELSAEFNVMRCVFFSQHFPL